MAKKKLLQNKTEACHKRWDDLSEKINLLQEQLDLETRVDEKLRLKSIISSINIEREQIEAEIQALDQEDTNQTRQNLIQDALRMERNKAFDQAIKRWELVVEIDHENTQADNEITRLKQLATQYAQINEYTKLLSLRMVEIKSVFARVTRRLQELSDINGGVDVSLTALIENFLENKLSADDFVSMWEEMESGDSVTNVDGVNFVALSNRLKRGEIILFLGSDIPRLAGADIPDIDMVARSLAEKANYKDFQGSLSMIAQYYQMKPEYGRRALELHLNELLPSEIVSVPIYNLLTKIETPMILISAAYDRLLETSFKNAGEKFVVISSLLSAESDFPAGSILVQYSDRDYPELPVIEQELSRNRFLANGYSVIYKIRGSCHAGHDKSIAQQSDLTLSEKDYFSFARHADKLIPSYITKHFIGRGLLFLGYDPKQWEDRLIVNAILEKRQNSPESSGVIGCLGDRFTSAYWESRNVRQYSLDLNEFVSNLETLI